LRYSASRQTDRQSENITNSFDLKDEATTTQYCVDAHNTDTSVT